MRCRQPTSRIFAPNFRLCFSHSSVLVSAILVWRSLHVPKMGSGFPITPPPPPSSSRGSENLRYIIVAVVVVFVTERRRLREAGRKEGATEHKKVSGLLGQLAAHRPRGIPPKLASLPPSLPPSRPGMDAPTFCVCAMPLGLTAFAGQKSVLNWYKLSSLSVYF